MLPYYNLDCTTTIKATLRLKLKTNTDRNIIFIIFEII